MMCTGEGGIGWQLVEETVEVGRGGVDEEVLGVLVK